MIIADLNYDERIEKLKKDIEYVKEIKNALSDSRSEFRKFSKVVGLDFDALDCCFNNFEKTVLIDAYTLSEQLIKNSYYHILETGLDNEYLRQFLLSKLPKERFSPNVKYAEISRNIKNDLIPNFSFLIGEDNDYIKSYNHLIEERHRYAHTGNYLFQFETIDEVVVAIEYLYKELELIINHSNEYIFKFRNSVKEISRELYKTSCIVSNFEPSSSRSIVATCDSFARLQSKLKESIDDYSGEYSLFIFSDFKNKSATFITLEIREDKMEEIIVKFNEVKHAFDELQISSDINLQAT